MHDEYMDRFKFFCEQMENKFFKPTKNGTAVNTFIFGDKITVVDHVYYQELLSAMILSGQGTQSELFSADTAFRMYKLKNLCNWYRQVSADKVSKNVSERFMKEMKSSGVVNQSDDHISTSQLDNQSQEISYERKGSTGRGKSVKFASDKSVKFAMDRSVKFGDE